VDGAKPVLLRDIFGNLFREVRIDPAWLAWNDGTVITLARGAYEQRDLLGGLSTEHGSRH